MMSFLDQADRYKEGLEGTSIFFDWDDDNFFSFQLDGPEGDSSVSEYPYQSDPLSGIK